MKDKKLKNKNTLSTHMNQEQPFLDQPKSSVNKMIFP